MIATPFVGATFLEAAGMGNNKITPEGVTLNR
jgi:hypothetical protein